MKYFMRFSSFPFAISASEFSLQSLSVVSSKFPA